MGFVLLGIAILLVVLITLVAIPIDVAFNIDRVDKLQGQVNIRWLFGLVRFRIGLPGVPGKKPPKPEAKPAPAEKPKERENRAGLPNILGALKQSPFRRRVYRFIKDIFRAAHSRDLFIHLRIGLGDPADTGRLWAVLGPVAALAASVPGAEVRVLPEFMDPVFEFQSHGRFRLIPLQFLALVIGFALSPSSVRAWRSLHQRKV